MSETQSTLDRAAKALYELSAEPEHGETWESLSEPWKQNLRDHVKAVIYALKSPMHPINSAICAGHKRRADRTMLQLGYERGLDAILGEDASHG